MEINKKLKLLGGLLYFCGIIGLFVAPTTGGGGFWVAIIMVIFGTVFFFIGLAIGIANWGSKKVEEWK